MEHQQPLQVLLMVTNFLYFQKELLYNMSTIYHRAAKVRQPGEKPG